MGTFPYRVLIVDDEEVIRMSCGAMLSHAGYEVRTAADGFEALAAMRGAPPDVLISDLNMPRMSGFELLSVVRRRFPQMPVVAISGTFDLEGPRVLADAFFPKGEYSPEKLVNEIQLLLAQVPIRPPLPKPDLAPVWLPRNGSYVVITCTECLRSFSLPEEEAENGPREVPCIFCDALIRFALCPKSERKMPVRASNIDEEHSRERRR